MVDQVPFQTIPMPESDWSLQWGRQVVLALRAIMSKPVRLQRYTVSGVPAAATLGEGAMVYISNEAGGAVPAFSDGTNWRRVTDRAVIS